MNFFSSKNKQLQLKTLEYSIENLQALNKQLLHYSKQKINQKNLPYVIDMIKCLVDFILWGEKHNDNFFDFFCENNVLETLFQLLIVNSQLKEIQITLIQQIGMLTYNISNQNNSNYILSNPFLGQFINYPYNFNEDEIVDYYINFSKSLCLKLDSKLVQLFFNVKNAKFPLLQRALRFFNHKDSMVRTSVQNILLSLMKIDEPKIQEYFGRFPFIMYFAHFCCFLKESWKKIDDMILESEQQQKLKEMLDDQVDMILTIQDMLLINLNEKVNNNLFNAFMAYSIFPGVIGSITESKKGQTSINTALYLLILFFSYFSHKDILNILTIILFSFNINDQLTNVIYKPSKIPCSYTSNWKEINHFWDDYQQFMNIQVLEIFLQQDQIQENQQCDPKFISSWDGGKCELELYRLSRAFGYPVVKLLCPEQEMQQFNIKKIYQNTLADYMLDEQDTEKIQLPEQNIPELKKIESLYKKNIFREIVIQFLLSKDDNLILMTVTLIQKIINNKNISNKVLEHCGLLTLDRDSVQYINNGYNFDSIQQIQSLLVKHLTLDPPLRICTLKVLSQLIQQFSLEKNQKIRLFTQDQLENFNLAYTMSLQKIQNILKNNIVSDFLLDLFEIEYKSIQESLNNYKINILNVISPTNINKIFDLEYRLDPVGNREITRRDIIVFSLLYFLRYTLINQSNYKDVCSFDQIKQNVLGSHLLSLKSGQICTFDIDQITIPCQLMKDKDLGQECFIITNHYNFILVKSMGEKKMKILHFTKLINLEISSQQKNNMLIAVKEIINGKELYTEINLSFTTQQDCIDTRSLLIENRLKAKQFDMEILNRFISMAESDIFKVENFQEKEEILQQNDML